MTRLPGASALTANSIGWGFFLCTDKSARTGRGGDYLSLTLADATGEVVARVFDNVDRLREEFDAGEFVKVQGRANIHNGRLQFLVENIRRVMTGPDSQDRRDGFREDTLVPSAPRPVDEMWRELQQVVAAVANTHLRALLLRIVSEHEAALRLWPAARVVHHAYRGGLLEHILTMAEAGRMLAVLYGANADLVVTGAVLHDIGKLEELEYETATTYTRDGNMIGHITLGSIMVHDACRAIAGFPDALRAQVLHLIGSHHGERALGSPVEPLSLEAFILSAVDDLDATINQVKRAIRDDDGGGEFAAYHSRLGRALWKGDTK
jgi:3'-5' exoribonuclease